MKAHRHVHEGANSQRAIIAGIHSHTAKGVDVGKNRNTLTYAPANTHNLQSERPLTICFNVPSMVLAGHIRFTITVCVNMNALFVYAEINTQVTIAMMIFTVTAGASGPASCGVGIIGKSSFRP